MLEDNAADVLFGEALRTCPIPADLTVAHAAEQAAKLLLRNDFKLDLIVLDLNLTVMSGHDFVEQFCNRRNGPPYVVFSGSQNEQDWQMALELGSETGHRIVQRWGKHWDVNGASSPARSASPLPAVVFSIRPYQGVSLRLRYREVTFGQ